MKWNIPKVSLLILLGIFTSAKLNSQNKKPKVALVLSGGGAKGVAHIPTLQALDSLGIVPDLVVGNSMGSIVGGLYAMGYSGNDIAEIVKTADWDKLIGGGLSLDNVSNEEKSEFGQYVLNVDLIKKKLKINSFILNDQYLRTFIVSQTYPVYDVTDFDALSIPFRAIATDIVAGKEVILDSGSLALAMRASMSIPAVFSAVPYNNTLLIDGGILNNFPVDVAKNMGMDFIIGSDVGNGMLDIDKLDNLEALLFQAGMLASNVKNPENRKLCDILINHGPHITHGTSDFNKANAIYTEGKIALIDAIPKLIALSDTLRDYRQRERYLPNVKDTIVLNSVLFEGVSEDNLNLIKSRSGLFKKSEFNKTDVVKGINRAMGTSLFSQIEFGFIKEQEETVLKIKAKERSGQQLKLAVHYDNDQDTGLILNYTARNILGNASRSLITLDVSKNPKLRLQHQNILGQNKNWWWRSEAFGSNYKQGLFLSGFQVDEINYRFLNLSSQLNRNIDALKSYVGVGIAYENSNLKPTLPPELISDELRLKKYNYQTVLLNASYRYNSLNSPYFPTSGSSMAITYKASIDNTVDLKTTANDSEFSSELNNYHKFILDASTRIPINSKTTAIAGMTSAFIFEDDLAENESSFLDFGIGIQYFLGGNTLLARSDTFLMPGLKEGEAYASQITKLNIGLQYELQKKLFLTPHLDVAVFGTQSFSDYLDNFGKSTSNWSETITNGFILSSGLTASYNSILGPIHIDASFVNGLDKVRFFVGVGYNFIGL